MSKNAYKFSFKIPIVHLLKKLKQVFKFLQVSWIFLYSPEGTRPRHWNAFNWQNIVGKEDIYYCRGIAAGHENNYRWKR